MEIKHILRNLCKFCIAFWGAVTRIRLCFCLWGERSGLLLLVTVTGLIRSDGGRAPPGGVDALQQPEGIAGRGEESPLGEKRGEEIL